MTVTRQQQYDQQALDSLKSRLPQGAEINGPIVTLPVPVGTPPSKLAVGSIRVSKGREKMISPEIQWDSVEQFCRSKNLVLHKVFLDMHKTGRDFEKRAVAQMVEEVKRGDYETVVLWKWSRWGRNVRWSSVYLASIEEAGGQVRAATEDINPKTAVGKFTRTQLLALAELESDLKSEGWKETHANRRQRKLPHTSAPRWGYTYTSSGYVVVEDEAAILKDLYRRFVRGETMTALTRHMNERGHYTRSGQPWTPTSLGRMLDTGFAAGLIRERSNPPKAANNKQSIKHFDIWREGAHASIISKQLWEKYKARRLNNASLPRQVVAAKHPLSGLMVCAACGGNMVSLYSSKNMKHTWTCGQRQRDLLKSLPTHEPVNLSNRRALDVVRTWIEENAEGGEDMTLRLARIAKAETTPRSHVDNLQARVKDLNAQSLDLSRQKMKRQISEEHFTLLKAEVDVDLAQAESALRRARAETRSGAGAAPTRAQWDSLLVTWDVAQAAPDRLRGLVSTVVGAVVVRPGPFVEGKAFVVPAWA